MCLFSFTIIRSLLSHDLDNKLQIFSVSTGTLMFPLILENSPLPYIIAIFLMTIIFDIRTFSNLLKSWKTWKMSANSSLLQIAWHSVLFIKRYLSHQAYIAGIITGTFYNIVHFIVLITLLQKCFNWPLIKCLMTYCANVLWPIPYLPYKWFSMDKLDQVW